MGFLDRVNKFFNGPPELDLGTSDDELAYQIEWTHLIHGGTNFTTHRLFKSLGTNRDKIIIEATIWRYNFSASL